MCLSFLICFEVCDMSWCLDSYVSLWAPAVMGWCVAMAMQTWCHFPRLLLYLFIYFCLVRRAEASVLISSRTPTAEGFLQFTDRKDSIEDSWASETLSLRLSTSAGFSSKRLTLVSKQHHEKIKGTKIKYKNKLILFHLFYFTALEIK